MSVTSSAQQAACVQDQADETPSQDSSSEAVARTPPPKSSAVAASAPTTPAGSHATQGIKHASTRKLSDTSIYLFFFRTSDVVSWNMQVLLLLYLQLARQMR